MLSGIDSTNVSNPNPSLSCFGLHNPSIYPTSSLSQSTQVSKMSTCCRKKAVLVAVYVETPRQRRLSSNHYHHHRHLHLHRPKHGGSRGGGYNRKAQLLDYSRRLRESAQSESSSPLIHNSAPSHHQQQHHPMNQIISVPMKRNDSKHARLPSCLGNLKFSFLTFIRSSSTKKERKRNKPRDTVSASTKVKAIMKRFQDQKRSGLFSKFMSAFQKRR